MKFMSFFPYLFLSTLIQAQESSLSPSEAINTQHMQAKEENLRTLVSVGESYIALLNRIGANQDLSHEKDVLSLCAPDCKKIVNGSLWYEGVEHFVPQLLSTGEKVGFWSIKPLDMIPGKDDRTVVIRFLAPTEKAGIWNSLVILRCNDELLITEINEIFNSYEGPH
jgi:hypothetical protein